MQTPKIKVTNNYSLFSFYKSNREADHFVKVMKSIEERDLTPYNPILVDRNKYIIDGQNRFFACKELKIPIYYITIENGSEKDIPILNSTQKNWTLNDYVIHFAERKNENYIKLNELQQALKFTGFTISVIILFFKNTTSDVVRNGKFIFDDSITENILYADKICEIINENKNKKTIIQKSSLARGVWSFVLREINTGFVNKTKFLNTMKIRAHMVEKRTSTQGYYNMLIDIWNYHKKNDKKRPYASY